MSLNKNPLYSLADISIIPCVTTTIESRSQCHCLTSGIEENAPERLPVIVSPMSCNYTKLIEDVNAYTDCGINIIIPRTVDLEERKRLCNTWMTAFSLKEAEMLLEETLSGNINICIDMANGHMEKQLVVGSQLRKKYGDRLKLMGGNIANPETYLEYVKAGFDYLRVGIGGGNACVLEGTLVTMADGSKKRVEEIQLNEEILTKKGPHKVVDKTVRKTDRYFKINEEICCTQDHEFFVIKSSDIADALMFGNILDYGEWVPAFNLKKEDYRLIKMKNEIEINLVEISEILVQFEERDVYDLEIEEEHSYIANEYIVHNCLTSTQTGVHYPMASLIDEVKKLRDRGNKTKIIADGGISGYSDITKCLALGADYVMMGKVFTKASLHGEPIGSEVPYYGMSTKAAQREMGGLGNKTSEGKSVMIKKEYTLTGWTENFTDYLRSAMSYTGANNLEIFKNFTECHVISPNSSYAINNK